MTLTRTTQQSNHVPLAVAPPSTLSFVRSPWTNASQWKPLVVRRILMSTVIVSPILLPCQARESIIVVRIILVISPESSHHRYKVVLVLARARMCGHLPLICSAYVKKPTRLTSAFLMNRFIRSSPWCYFHLLTDAVHFFLALWGSDSL
jgi:hypothetical protein